mmetsp:Transcript_7400/g.22425  ORF Transcript_7400/g.22425 Transcript_7400/m.22425 type:complete len:374 (-) Transcript_7400:4714-5835(-)
MLVLPERAEAARQGHRSGMARASALARMRPAACSAHAAPASRASRSSTHESAGSSPGAAVKAAIASPSALAVSYSVSARAKFERVETHSADRRRSDALTLTVALADGESFSSSLMTLHAQSPSALSTTTSRLWMMWCSYESDTRWAGVSIDGAAASTLRSCGLLAIATLQRVTARARPSSTRPFISSKLTSCAAATSSTRVVADTTSIVTATTRRASRTAAMKRPYAAGDTTACWRAGVARAPLGPPLNRSGAMGVAGVAEEPSTVPLEPRRNSLPSSASSSDCSPAALLPPSVLAMLRPLPPWVPPPPTSESAASVTLRRSGVSPPAALTTMGACGGATRGGAGGSVTIVAAYASTSEWKGGLSRQRVSCRW